MRHRLATGHFVRRQSEPIGGPHRIASIGSDPAANRAAPRVAEWRGLIAKRWTLIEQFERDGQHFLLARCNEAMPGVAALAPRERQALHFASQGHTNKVIAYEMGISCSTVSVLLCRAAKKLRTRSRAALIAAFLAISEETA